MSDRLHPADIEAIARRVAELLDPRVPVAEPTKRDTQPREYVETLVLEYVRANGPASANTVQSGVGRRRSDVRAALRRCEHAGRLQRVDDLWAVPSPVPDARNGHGDAELDRTEATITLEAAQTDTGHEFVGGECLDPSICEYRGRHAAGSWSCEFNHPRREPTS